MINSMAGEAHVEALRGRAWRAPPPPSQRQRLLRAITRLAIDEGYRDVTVARIVAGAGVSRPTFYEHFDDREACFLAALAPTAQQLLDGIRQAVARERPQHALRAATQALLEYACSQPARARLLMSDPLTGGGRLRDARDELVDDAARIVEQAHARLPSGALVPELPPWLTLGVTCRLLASRLRHGSPRVSDLAEELPGWIAAYELPVARHCWRSLAALPPPARSPFLPPTALLAPPALAPGRRRGAAGALAENHWLRIVFATAEVIRRDGYEAATVAQITEAAGVDSRAFYRLFACKREALVAANELLFRHAMAAAAGAFVAGQTWPERVWEAARALIQYVERSPTLTYVSLIESHAGGSSTGPRVDDLARAFTIFLQEGHPYPRERSARSSARPSELALEAIGTAAFELGYRHARKHGGEHSATPLSSLLAQIVFISLAPFLGADEASDFVCRQTLHGRGRAPLASAA